MLIVSEVAVAVLSSLALLSYLLRWKRHKNKVVFSRAIAWGVVVLLYVGIIVLRLAPGDTRSWLVSLTWMVMAIITSLDNWIVYKYEDR